MSVQRRTRNGAPGRGKEGPRSRSYPAGRLTLIGWNGLAKRRSARGAILFVVLLLPCLAAAQSAPPPGSQPAANPSAPQTPPSGQQPAANPGSPVTPLSGPQAPVTAPQTSAEPSPAPVIAFAEYQGSSSALGMVMSVTADAGVNISDRFAVDIGLPLYFVRSPFSPVLNHDWLWSKAIGDPYLDVRYTRPYHHAQFTSILTGFIPVANEERIYSTGRAGVDWFNHVEQTFGGFTPFLNVGASNGAVDRFIMPRPFTEARPYQSLGFLGDAEAGSDYKLHKGLLKGLGGGASFYGLLPAGPQKVFSRFVLPYSALAGDGHHDRHFDKTFETVGPSKIARDNGYSGWLDISRWYPFDLQLGYTHSVHYALDAYTVTLTFDGRALVKKLTGY